MDTLTPSETARTVNQIGALIGLGPDISMNEAQARHVLENTLIRRIHPDWFNPDAVPLNRLGHTKETSSIWLGPLQIPNPLPVGWSVGRKEGRLTEYVIEPGDLLKPCTRKPVCPSGRNGADRISTRYVLSVT